MKIEIEIPDDDVRGVLECVEDHPPRWMYSLQEMMNAAGDSRWWEILETKNNPDCFDHYVRLNLERGLRMMLTESFVLANRQLSGNPKLWDTVACDAFVQYAAFGEIRYA